MNAYFTDKLIKDFPLTFRMDFEPKHSFQTYVFECGDGWEASIRKTAEKLEPLIKEYSTPEDPIYTVQLKSKFGTGRWYLSNTTDQIDNLITEWEFETKKICELCGKEGELRNNEGWYYTSCDKHKQS